MFLLEDSNEKKLAGLLEYNVGAFSSQGVPTAASSSNESNIRSKYAPMNAPGESEVKSKFAPMAAPAATATGAPVGTRAPTRPVSVPVASSQTTTATLKRPSVGGIIRIATAVIKGPHGIGLDISKGIDGRTVVKQFKELPPGVPNPAMNCNPPIRPGDVITEVNGVVCHTFMEAVKMIKGSEENVHLMLERSSV